MKKTNRNKVNIIFSSFLVIGYIICTYFFSTLASQVGGAWGSVIQALILVVFGLLLFYATRVGEGRQVKRFSLAVLLLVVVPSLYIILAALIPGMPLHDMLAPSASLMGDLGSPKIIFSLACVALGYGIPYTFFSGYEIKEEEDIEEEIEKTEQMLEGGLAEELAKTEAEDKAEVTDSAVEETAVETEAAADTETKADEEPAAEKDTEA